jgi:hypothetical protein
MLSYDLGQAAGMEQSKHAPKSIMKLLSRVFHVLSIITLIGCVSAPFTLVRGDDAGARQEKLNGGYFLLHQLCDDDAQLPLLLDVKHAPEAIETFAIRISKTAKESNSLLEQMQDSDPALNFDRNPLPSIERDVRASIQDEKQHQLLFGTSDDAFVRALLVSQVEASNYGRNLAKVLSEQESDAKRIKLLERISAKWLAIHSEAFRLLSTVQ